MMQVSAFVFEGRKNAAKVLDRLEEQAPMRTASWTDDVAIISRGKHGLVRVNSSWAQYSDDTKLSAGFAAITGGLVGAVFGPSGALAGALGGGVTFGLVGAGLDVAVDNPRLKEFASRMKDDSSALVLVADKSTAADFVSAVKPFEAELFETELNERDVKALRKKLKANKAQA